jgi:phage baseplate assembly protein W
MEAIRSQLSLLFSTELGDVPHIPEYGVKKRDLLFTTDVDDTILGQLILRMNQAIDLWFSIPLLVVDVIVLSQKANTVILKVDIKYNNDSASLEVIAQ